IGGGYLVGHTALRGWPPVPPLERVDWLWYLTVAAVAGANLEAGGSSRGRLRWGLRGPPGAGRRGPPFASPPKTRGPGGTGGGVGLLGRSRFRCGARAGGAVAAGRPGPRHRRRTALVRVGTARAARAGCRRVPGGSPRGRLVGPAGPRRRDRGGGASPGALA